MKIHKSISQLTGREQTDLRKVTKRLVENISPELIFCYGSRVAETVTRSCFTQKRRNEDCLAMYDLVIIISDNEQFEDTIITTLAERLLKKDVLANVIVHREGFVHTEIEEGNFFFSWIFRSAIILYDKNNALKRMPPLTTKTKCFKMYPQTAHAVREHFANAKSYLSAAGEQYRNNVYADSLYLLNQSAVSSCKSVIRGCLGYEIISPGLGKLISLTCNFTEEIFNVLPRDTKEERHLFSLLSEVPTADKNNELGTLHPEEISILLERVQQMQQVSEDIKHQKAALTTLLQIEED
jgi:hypothetical protein